jgi:penicillin-binding protein 1A
MLAGLLVAPGKYSPYVNPIPAKKRQHYVLERMEKLNKITKQQHEQALSEKTIFFIHEDDLKAGYFTEWVRQKVVDVVGEEEFSTNGFRVKTTLDWSLQKIAEEQVIRGVKEIDKRQGYKGPFAHLDETDKFEIENRKKILKKYSHYFVIDEKNEKKYEFNFDENNYKVIKDEELKLKKNFGDEKFIPGVNDKDDLVNVLKFSEQYEAVVTKVDDALRLIHVSVAGTPGIIPFENFKWAHKRSVSENTAYYQEVTKPSSILKVGDLVYVQMTKLPTSIMNYLNKESVASLNKIKNSGIFKTQKYLICLLDQIPEVQGALFSIDARTGEVISYVGGNDFKSNKFNRVIQAKRQPGSSFKPLLFAAALEKGYSPTTIIMDTPEAMPGFDSASSWKPKNYDGEYKGPITMRIALEQSRNIPTIKIADKVGVNTILKFIDRIGFNAKLEANLSIALGTFGVSPRDMVSTYAMFPNGGKYITPKAILSVTDRNGKKYQVSEIESDMKNIEDKLPDGKVLPIQDATLMANPFTKNLTSTQVYDPRLAYVMTGLMKGVVTSGTAASARDLSPNIAGKTGTTNDYVDAWFVGFTSNVVTAVWTGFDDNKTLGFGETGGRSALPIWKEYMRANIKKFGDQPFEMPIGVTTQWVDKESGRKAQSNSIGAILENFADANIESAGSVQNGGPNPSTAAPKVRSSDGDDEYYSNQ